MLNVLLTLGKKFIGQREVDYLISVKSKHKSWIEFTSIIYRRARARFFLSKKQLGKEELKQLKSVIKSGNLYYGQKLEQFCDEFAKLYNVRYAIASSSGTASIHTALAMLNPNPGDEIIVPPLTDMGTIVPIIWQNAIPVFVDVHPHKWTIDAENLEKAITPKTKAIIAVHIFGAVCDMDAILDVARKHGIPVIEDCSQAHLAEYKHQLVGTIGDIGCFSLQQSKQITTGEGGMTITNRSEWGTRGSLFVDKGWDRSGSGLSRRYITQGLNYRMTELQAGVGIAQLQKLESITKRRNRNGELLNQLLMDVDGITPQQVDPSNKHTYLFFGMTVDPDATFGADALVRALVNRGVVATAHYIGDPIFLTSDPLMKKEFYGNSHFPFDHPDARNVEYEPGMCPITQDVLDRLVLLNITERYSENDIKNVANQVRRAVSELSGVKVNLGSKPPTVTRTPEEKKSSSQQLEYRVGIIGCGNIAHSHASAYHINTNVTIAAIADTNPDALKTKAHEFSISHCYDDYRKMLEAEQLDIVSICTWPGLHAEMTVAATESGVKAILCEKPMALNLAEADKMIEACRRTGTQLIVSHQLRFNPHIHKARHLVETGVIGKPHLVWGHYSSSLFDRGTHVVDAMRYMLGDPQVDWVLGQIERKKDSYDHGHLVEDIAAALVQFSNGTRGLLETGDLAESEFGVHIYGEEGLMHVELGGIRLQARNLKDWQQIQLPAVKEHSALVTELIACLNGQTEPHRNDAYHARIALEILIAVFESVRTHGVVRFPVTIDESPLDAMVKSGVL